jgi:hypothetical protein
MYFPSLPEHELVDLAGRVVEVCRLAEGACAGEPIRDPVRKYATYLGRDPAKRGRREGTCRRQVPVHRHSDRGAGCLPDESPRYVHTVLSARDVTIATCLVAPSHGGAVHPVRPKKFGCFLPDMIVICLFFFFLLSWCVCVCVCVCVCTCAYMCVLYIHPSVCVCMYMWIQENERPDTERVGVVVFGCKVHKD